MLEYLEDLTGKETCTPESESSPGEIFEEIYGKHPVVSGRFLECSLMRRRGLSREDATRHIEDYEPKNEEPSRLDLAGFGCPFCGSWKSIVSFKLALNRMKKRNPILARQLREALKETGFPL